MDLRANTAVDVLIGPFVDATDGSTAETGLTLDVELSKNGQALANKNDATTATHDAAGTIDGHYNCELDATDTNTEGNLVLLAYDSAALVVRHEYNVLSEAAWDSLYAAKDTGFMDVNIKTIGRADTQETEANNLESACSNYSATRGLTGTAVPAVAADGAGGLPVSDAGGLDLDTILDVAISGRMATYTQPTGFLAATFNAEIGASATAMDNFEDMYDGTGYTSDTTAPASRAQVSGIGAASGGALNFANSADNVDSALKSITFDGSEDSGTNASVNAEDATYHQIGHSSNNIDIVYEFSVGGSRTATEVTWKGDLVGSNDEATIQAYNGSGWDSIGTINGTSGAPSSTANNQTVTASLLAGHTGSGSDLGKIWIRIECAAQTSPTLYTDMLLVAAVNVGQSVGYSGGFIYVDTVSGTAGSEDYVNGVADNPASNWADALTINTSLGLNRFNIAAGSSITLTADATNYHLQGQSYSLALEGYDIDGAYIFGANVSGTGTADSANHPVFEDCPIGTVTLPPSIMRRCYLSDTITNSAAGDWFINHCMSRVAGSSSPTFDFGAAVANTNLNMRLYSGGIQIDNKDANGTDLMSLEGNGALIVDSSSSGAISCRGNFKVTNTGGATITYDDNTANTVAILADSNELQTDWADGGRLDLIQDIIAADTTTDIPALIAGLENIAASDVLTQVNAALDTAIAELGVATPTATPTLRTGLMLMYMMARNRVDVDTTGTDAMKIYNDAGTQITSKAITDDGTDYSEAEMS